MPCSMKQTTMTVLDTGRNMERQALPGGQQHGQVSGSQVSFLHGPAVVLRFICARDQDTGVCGHVETYKHSFSVGKAD